MWTLCINGDWLFSGSSDKTIKVTGMSIVVGPMLPQHSNRQLQKQLLMVVQKLKHLVLPVGVGHADNLQVCKDSGRTHWYCSCPVYTRVSISCRSDTSQCNLWLSQISFVSSFVGKNSTVGQRTAQSM